jgi:hypothetical protein
MSVHLVTPETAEVINLEPFEPVTVGILEDGSHTGHWAGVIRGSLPPGGGGPPQHVHREHDGIRSASAQDMGTSARGRVHERRFRHDPRADFPHRRGMTSR